MVPKVLLSNSRVKNTYDVLLVTDKKSKSGISYPNSGVQMLFVNKLGKSCMHYISRYDENDKKRFEMGNIDKIELEVPYIEELDNVWLFPEDGTWGLSKMVVYDKINNNTITFKCCDIIGTDLNQAIILKKEDEKVLNLTKYLSGMNDYDLLKKDLLMINAYLVVFGTFITYFSNTNNYLLSKTFLEGGLLGIVYLFLLEIQSDCIGSSENLLLLPLISGPIRLVLITYITISSDILSEASLLLPYTLGFFMYKISVIVVGMNNKSI